jgi:pyruvate,orthophosphate dikinase
MTKHKAPTKWVYLFHEGNASMRNLLGGKGAGLAEMSNTGIPVPPGFTITTEACNAYFNQDQKFPDDMWEQVLQGIRRLEKDTGKTFGGTSNPLLVSVRSGSSVSMPGMMDTVLNLGLNGQSLQGLASSTGNARSAHDAYRRFIQMFSRVVLGVPGETFEKILARQKEFAGVRSDTGLSAEDLNRVWLQFLESVQEKTGGVFPQDPLEQLRLAIKAVFASWNGKRAIDYRNFHNISQDLGTAVSVVTMVFGNLGDSSGTGVVFTRNPATGEKTLFGEYLSNAQGEDVVAGIRTPQKIDEVASAMPQQYQELLNIAERLEKHYRDAQDLEFTVERGRLYMLQTRSAQRTAQAAVKIAVDMVREGLITKEEALLRIEPEQMNQFLLPRFDESARSQAIDSGNLLASGLNASPGAASGKAVFDPDTAQAMGLKGENIILVRPETNPDDVHGMIHAKGILTARGGATSHAAVIARGMGKPCVAGAEALVVDPIAQRFTVGNRVIVEGENISIDGSTGEVFAGSLPTIPPNFNEAPDLQTILSWANETKTLGVWANADYPRDAQRALEFGAEGIGLCRTEHMFFEEERLPIVRQMILAAGEATRLEQKLATAEENAASSIHIPGAADRLKALRSEVETSAEIKQYYSTLKQLLEFQIEDFTNILRVMDGKPVIIRLLDPPLHEFLPRYEELLEEIITLRINGNNPDELQEKEQLLTLVKEMREVNPMLGLRGCRLGLMYGAINEMQARAIFSAACALIHKGLDPRPEIMVPLVSHANELQLVRRQIEAVAKDVQSKEGLRLNYKIGTMIELPRAALTGNEIAAHAEFFSFGTNDLTQTTFGFSRDDAEASFLLKYVRQGILPENPFQVLDRAGVGQLIKMAVELGRSANPALEVGICGEHGGDPSSIEFCQQVGLDYVSASPFRVPVARLAAARAALASRSLEARSSNV